MTGQDFIDAGYTRWEPVMHKDCVTDLYQKWFKDDYGKRYAITVECWDFSRLSANIKSPRFEWSVQFTHKQTNETVDIECLHGWSIKDAEKFYADLWKTGWFKYYERYDYADDEEEEETKEKDSNAE